MINDVDFVYDYSDLHRMNVRVKFLTGKFADFIIEFTNIWLDYRPDGNDFSFDYLLFQIPEKMKVMDQETFQEFKEHMGYTLVDIISHRKNNKNDWKRLIRADKITGRKFCSIKIYDKYYKKTIKVKHDN